MARVVDINVTKILAGRMVTTHTDGSYDEYLLKVGDFVEGLRYVKNETVESVTGKITAIKCSCLKYTKVKVSNPVDYFAKDVKITEIVVDASSEYKSDVVTIDAREIVEWAGVTDVTSVHVLAHEIVDLEIIYSDDTVEYQSLEIGDYIENAVIMAGPGKPDIVGNFKVAAWSYTAKGNKPDVTGLYLVTDDKTIGNHLVKFGQFIRFVEVPKVEVTSSNSLASVAAALNLADEVSVCLGVDVDIPIREDGKISTIMINEGKTVDLDLSGHSITTLAYAFYVNGGELNISDSTGNGAIKATIKNSAYPAVFVANGGTCNMTSGLIDTTDVDLEDDDYNWLYGVVCSGDGVFNMTGGQMIIGAASGISITNGTASGEGAQFIIGGDAVITSKECAGVYLADNKSVIVKDNAVIDGGIVARMGDITVKDKARVIAQENEEVIVEAGVLACQSGVEAVKSAILALTGCYNSSLGNDLNINIEDYANISSKFGASVEIAEVNTKFDQKARVNINSNSNIRSGWKVTNHEELAEQATAGGRTLPAETNTTDLEIVLNKAVVYPVVD